MSLCKISQQIYIMKVERERNIFLKRISSDRPHKYFHDIHDGKYYLIGEDGKKMSINKIGTFKPKFREKKSGFMNHTQRIKQAQSDIKALHYVPDATFQSNNQLYTPVTRKFVGYFQQPYLLKKNLPKYLDKPNQFDSQPAPHILRKNASLQEKKKKKISGVNPESLILNHSTSMFYEKGQNDHYFQTSFQNMTTSRPIPTSKKTCYNYKCKYQRYFSFDEKSKLQTKTKMESTMISSEKTFGKSFFDRKINEEKKQQSLMKDSKN